MAYYTGKSGRIYRTTDQIGIGGEGAVLAIEGNSEQVIKLYKQNKFKTAAERQTLERKLRVMISMNVPILHNGHICLAWPQDIVYENGIMAGFVMPKISAKYKIYDIYRGGKNSVRARLYPDFNWKYSVQFSHNLAWIVNQLHNKNIVIGDFNQNNIAVDVNTGTIILLDCDSFDITDPSSGEHFPCGVGLPEMLAPELQRVGSLSNGRFTKESDNFSLAIHIFRLLMENADPFGGIVTLSGAPSVSESGANKAIINGECAYVRNVPSKKIPKWSPPIEALPKEVVQLFQKTFNYTALNAMKRISYRATAGEWVSALAPYGAKEPNPLLKRCPKNRNHVYAKHNAHCPWCALDSTPVRVTPSARVKPKKKWPLVAAVLCVITVVSMAIGVLQSYNPTDRYQPYQHTEQATQATVRDTSEYILPNSDCAYISEADLHGLTKEELCLARNEIFARHGRIFTTKWIRDYFMNTSWYVERYDPEEFDRSINQIFNEYERKNLDTIVAYEEKKGYR